MYGGTETIRAHGPALRTAAGDLRARAAAVSARAESCCWTSSAALVLRSRVESLADELTRRAHALDAAADTLEAHARAADVAIELIATARSAAFGDARAAVTR
jgi:hypothetical protein